MSQDTYNPAERSLSRVFILEGRARPDHEPDYQGCARAGPASQNFGGTVNIECPSPDRFGEFVVVGESQSQKERGTTTVMARFPLNVASELLRLAKKRCQVDIHYNFGRCRNPKAANAFEKKMIIENARIEAWSADDLGALESSENAAITESVEITYVEQYEVLPLKVQSRGSDVIFNPIVDMVKCDRASCGDCDDESTGCEKVYAIADTVAGSPGTAADVLYSQDKGATWATDEVNSLLAGEQPNAIACLDDYVVVVSEDSESLHYKLATTILAGTALGWIENATGFVATYGPLDIDSVGDYAFIVGESGYVYGCINPTNGVVVLDAGIATTNNLNAVDALTDLFAVAVGASDTIIWTRDRITWNAATATGGGNNLLAVLVLTEDVWIVGDSGGDVYYTLDHGQTWTQSILPVTLAQINDIKKSTDSVLYMAAETATPNGRILRSYDQGYSWQVVPEAAGSSIPASDSFDALAVCSDDPNWFAAGGLADDGTDGIIVVGND